MKLLLFILLILPPPTNSNSYDDFINGKNDNPVSEYKNIDMTKIHLDNDRIQKEIDEKENKAMDIIEDIYREASKPTPYSHCYSYKIDTIDYAECINNGNKKISTTVVCNGIKLFTDEYYLCLSDVALHKNNFIEANKNCNYLSSRPSDYYHYCKSKIFTFKKKFHEAEISCIHIKYTNPLQLRCLDQIRNKKEEENIEIATKKEEGRNIENKLLNLENIINEDKEEIKTKIKNTEASIKELENQLALLGKALKEDMVSRKEYNKYNIIISNEINKHKNIKSNLLSMISKLNN